jgi:hypothetical protein
MSGKRRAILTPQGWVGLRGESKAELDDEEERHQEEEEEEEDQEEEEQEEQEADQDQEEMSVSSSSSSRRRIQPALGAAIAKKKMPLKINEPKLVFKAGWGL